MGSYLIDSNVFIEYLGNSLPDAADIWIEEMFDSGQHFTSVINKIEVLSFKTGEEDYHEMAGLFECLTILPLSEDIVDQTILIRQELKIKLPDAIIAASALLRNLILVTRNVSDFKNVPGLTVVDPYGYGR